jgi:pimeloyl-ACP methyl ester carboxylesterase
VVALFTRGADDFTLVDYFTAAEPGSWVFGVDPGTYFVAAFEDVNRDGAYEDEPCLRPDPARPLVVTAGQKVANLDLVIPRAGRALRPGRIGLAELKARSSDEQRAKSLYALSVSGMVTTLDDPRFGTEVGQRGMWQYYDFILKGGPGIYFLEPYDPKRIPVLFIHGIGGTPRDFTHLIGGLDRTRFQAWVLSYPTGARLDRTVQWVDQLFTRLQLERDVKKAVVVAHSMGGLVARGFVLQHDAADPRHVIRELVTISSPLGGMASAGEGVEKSPVIVRSWYGLAPGSAYLEGLYYTDPPARTVRRRLPDSIAYHLLFGFKGGGSDGSSDGVVTVASQLRPEAQEEAQTVRGFDETHTSILGSPAVVTYVNGLLAGAR